LRTPSVLHATAALLAALAVAPLATAQPTPQPTPRPSLQPAGTAAAAAPAWRRSELWGGDVRSLAFHPAQPQVVYAGTSAGHVYVSRDGGDSWSETGPPGALAGWVVSDLLFDPDVADRLWAALWGTHDGGLVIYSDDGGDSWQVPSRDLYGTKVYTLARVPGHPGRLYAGTLSGVWGSTDGGASWSRLTAQLPEVHKVTSLLVGPADPNRVIAGTWERAYRSDDGGRTWYGVFQGMILDSEVFTLTAVPGRPDELWASTCGWVYHSLDAGGRWQRFEDGFENRRTPAFAALPSGRLLAGTVGGLHLSDDGGAHWRRVGPAGLSVLDLAWHPASPDRVLVATEGSGVWVSDDGGATLHRAARGMRNLRIAALTRAGREVLAAVNNAGPASGVHTSRDGGASFVPESSELPAVRDLVVHGAAVYAATERGLYERAGGQWRRINEIGEERVEQVVSAGERLVVRTREGFWEQDGPRFRRLGYHHGPPRSAALTADALWVSDAAGLYRLTAASNDDVAVPFPDGRVTRFGDRLLWWGEGGVYARSGAGDPAAGEPWLRLTDGPARLLATGDAEQPVLVLTEKGAFLLQAASGVLRAVELPVPSHQVTSALVAGGRLLLGSAENGLYLKRL